MAINPVPYSPPPVLAYQGEGETKFATPDQAPAVVSAHEAANLLAFERHAAQVGGTLVDEHIILKYGFDPKTGRLEVVGGESRGTIVVGNSSQSSSSPSQPTDSSNSSSTDSSPTSASDQTGDTTSDPTTQENVLQQLRSTKQDLTDKLKSLNNSQVPQGLKPNQSPQELQNELDKIDRVISKLQNQKIFDQLLKTQGVISSAIDKNSAAAEKIMKAIHGGGSNGNGAPPRFPISRVATNSTTPVIGLLLNEFA